MAHELHFVHYKGKVMNINNIVITEINDVVTVYQPKGKPHTARVREHYGLSFALSGQITYEHKGIKYVSDTNSAVLIPKGETYKLYREKEGFFPLINFECTNFHPDTFTIIPLENTDYLKTCFDEMQKLFLSGRNRPMLMSKFYDIIAHLENVADDKTSPLSNAITYIEKNFHQSVTNSDLANECLIGEEYFRKLFKKEYGISPKQYIINIRIRKAKQMLSEGVLKINAISEKCGFSNPYHFCSFFKQKVGMSPSEYMNKNKIKII